MLRVLGVDARLDRRAGAGDLSLSERQRLPRRDPELPFDEIEAGHRLGHRMLDLEPGVHLEKIEVAGVEAARGIGDELDGARPDIARRQRGLGRGLGHRGARLLRQARRRAFLDHLLMPALRRAVALEEMDATPVRVGENLQFDVAGRGDIFLDQHPSVAERGLRLAACALELGVELHMGVDPPHAAPAPAGDRLDKHGIADLVGLLAQEFRVLVVAVIARHDRHAGPLHQRLGRVLQAHRAHRLRRRTDEDHARPGAAFRKFGVLGQESIARMQAFGADLLSQRDNGALVEIAVRSFADLVGFVGEPREQRAAVRRRVHGDRADPHPPRRADDPAGDLAAIGDEDIGEHGRLRTALVY